MEVLKIVLLVVLAAVLYGIAHDLVTAHLCVEYFTMGHPKVIDSSAPVDLALVWGVLATWWLGAGGGLLLAVATRGGSLPPRRARHLVRPVLVCFALLGVGAFAAGLLGRLLAAAGFVRLVGSTARLVPADRHVAYLGNLWAHLASYLLGMLLLIVLAVRVRRQRVRAAQEDRASTRPAATLTP